MFSSTVSRHRKKKKSVDLIDRVIPKLEKLADNFSRPAPQGVVVHGVGDGLLNTLDHGGSVGNQVKVHVHVVHVGDGIDRHFVVAQLNRVVEVRPVGGFCKNLCDFLDLLQLIVRFEHIFEDLELCARLSELLVGLNEEVLPSRL